MRPSDRTSPRVNVISRPLISPSINRDRDEPELLRRRLELASRRARREKSRNRTPNREMTCRRVGQRLELRFSKSFSFESANLNLDSSLKLLAAVAFSHLSGWRSCISKLTENSPPFSSSPLSLSLSLSLWLTLPADVPAKREKRRRCGTNRRRRRLMAVGRHRWIRVTNDLSPRKLNVAWRDALPRSDSDFHPQISPIFLPPSAGADKF